MMCSLYPGQSSLSAGALRYRAWAQSWSSAALAARSNVLACEIPFTAEPGGLQSMESRSEERTPLLGDVSTPHPQPCLECGRLVTLQGLPLLDNESCLFRVVTHSWGSQGQQQVTQFPVKSTEALL